MGTVRVRAIVSGQVQGVWYRQSCRQVAEAEGVHGWVGNNVDGTVEAVLEGDEEAVERVLAWMRSGPPRAVVEELRRTDEAPRGEAGFTIK